MHSSSRREFLGEVGSGMLLAGLGSTLLSDLGLAATPGRAGPAGRLPADLEALVRAMQRTAPDQLLPRLVGELKGGTALETLVAAGALANARTFGGGDYEGYHAFMALLPAHAMSRRMASGLEALPVLKVLYRNSARIQVAGGGREAMPAVRGMPADEGLPADPAAALREHVHATRMADAERVFARDCGQAVPKAFDHLMSVVEDDLNVHRITLAWRAWDMLRLVDTKHAHTVLRQVVRFCVDEERNRIGKRLPEPSVRTDVPRILERYGLLGRAPGTREFDAEHLEQLAYVIFGADRANAAEAVADALAEGFAPDAVAEAIALAANNLLLHDTGAGRVHGASVGVHACDAANAWRNTALANDAHRVPSLVVAAYHTGGQSQRVGERAWSYREAMDPLRDAGAQELVRGAAAAIEQRDQAAACAAVQLYGDAGHAPDPVLQMLLRYAVSEDGALHAEKFFHTVQEEFGRTRPELRWRWLIALARVTASEFGEPAPGVAKARELLTA